MTEPDIELVATAHEHELTVGYMGRTWHLFAWPLEDWPLWECSVIEDGTEGPTILASEWGVTEEFRDPWSALAVLTEAIIKKAATDGAM